MKHLLNLLCIFLIHQTTCAQVINNFDSYSVGDSLTMVSTDWFRWSGASEEEVLIDTFNSYNGDNSIHLFSSRGVDGGPQDVLLSFGGEYTLGDLDFSMRMFVENGKSAYFNIQGNETPGWSTPLQCFFEDDGKLLVEQSGNLLLQSNYVQGQWIKVGLIVDLNENKWKLYIDDVDQGKISIPSWANQLASLNLYPVNRSGDNDTSSYWVDNVRYTFTPYVVPPINAAAVSAGIEQGGGLEGQERRLGVTVANRGIGDILSLDIIVDYNGKQWVDKATNLNMAAGSNRYILTDSTIILSNADTTVDIVVTNVHSNGQDDDPSDDSISFSFKPVVPHPDRMMIAEVQTGTSCQFCVEGYVALEELTQEYEGLFQGISIHSQDAMEVPEYAEWIDSFYGAPPGASLFRTFFSNGGQQNFLEGGIIQTIGTAPDVKIAQTATYHDWFEEITLDIDVTLQASVDTGWHIFCVLIEDSITGPSPAYDQDNYYSGFTTGPGNYTALPDPVPASMMMYNDVARAILPSPAGEDAFGATPDSGATYSFSYVFPFSSTWKVENMAAVTVVLNEFGQIENGAASDISIVSNVEKEVTSRNSFSIKPNPANYFTYIEANISGDRVPQINVYNTAGQKVLSKTYKQLNGNYLFPINISDLEKGVYLVELHNGETQYREKLVVH